MYTHNCINELGEKMLSADLKKRIDAKRFYTANQISRHEQYAHKKARGALKGQHASPLIYLFGEGIYHRPGRIGRSKLEDPIRASIVDDIVAKIKAKRSAE